MYISVVDSSIEVQEPGLRGQIRSPMDAIDDRISKEKFSNTNILLERNISIAPFHLYIHMYYFNFADICVYI